mmetsp:Transcript_582/g.986  ORF Transcript_582/g.986 Transcript_582/m.986 type:complete len:707 (+) Transcript_582:1-2121(+)
MNKRSAADVISASPIRSEKRPLFYAGDGQSSKYEYGDYGYTPASPERATPNNATLISPDYKHTIKSRSSTDLGNLAVSFGTYFNDPIHGSIEIHPLCVRIINTRQFQRLDHLKQLGVSYLVYRGATHTRFSHSVGVAYLAEKVVKNLRDHQPELNITPKDLLCVTVAGLCHDLGHGPFSHIFDGMFIKRMHPNGITLPDKSVKKWRHEDGSVAMFKHLLEANHINLSDFGLDEADRIFIEEIISGVEEKDRIGRPAEKFYLYDIVNNTRSGLDVDKIDYFLRDMFFTNSMGSSQISFDRFIQMGRVFKAEPIEDSSPASSAVKHPPTITSSSPQQLPAVLSGSDMSPFPMFGQHAKNSKTLPKQKIVRKITLPDHEVVEKKPRDYAYMICYPDKLVLEAVDVFGTRFRMHQNVYTHKTVKKFEFMICDVLELADPYIRIAGSCTAYRPDGQYRMSECILDPCALANLNDHVIELIKHHPEPGLQKAKELIQRMESRDLYLCIGKTIYTKDNSLIEPLSESDIRNALVSIANSASVAAKVTYQLPQKTHCIEDSSDDAVTVVDDNQMDDEVIIHSQDTVFADAHYGYNNEVSREAAPTSEGVLLTVDDIIVEKMHTHYGLKDKNPVDRMRFYSKTTHPLHTVGRRVDKSYYASRSPGAFEELAVRVFCRSPVGSVQSRLARDAFLIWCESVQSLPGPPLAFEDENME